MDIGDFDEVPTVGGAHGLADLSRLQTPDGVHDRFIQIALGHKAQITALGGRAGIHGMGPGEIGEFRPFVQLFRQFQRPLTGAIARVFIGVGRYRDQDMAGPASLLGTKLILVFFIPGGRLRRIRFAPPGQLIRIEIQVFHLHLFRGRERVPVGFKIGLDGPGFQLNPFPEGIRFQGDAVKIPRLAVQGEKRLQPPVGDRGVGLHPGLQLRQPQTPTHVRRKTGFRQAPIPQGLFQQ